MTAMASHEQKTSTWYVNVLRIHILHIMKGSHTSTMAVMVDTDKYRLVGIPPNSREPPDIGLTKIW